MFIINGLNWLSDKIFGSALYNIKNITVMEKAALRGAPFFQQKQQSWHCAECGGSCYEIIPNIFDDDKVNKIDCPFCLATGVAF